MPRSSRRQSYSKSALSLSPLNKLLLIIIAIVAVSVVLVFHQTGVLGTSTTSNQIWTGGYMFKDLNNSGDRDINEPPFPGQEILLTQIGSTGKPILVSKTATDDNGYFEFRLKANPGVTSYAVQDTWPSGYTNTTVIAKKFSFGDKKLSEFGVIAITTDSCNRLKVAKFQKPCGDYASNRFHYVAYTCLDGTKGILGGSGSCKTSDQWQVYANKSCDGHGYCTPTPTPTIFPVVTPTDEPMPTITPTYMPTPTPTNQPTPTPTPHF